MTYQITSEKAYTLPEFVERLATAHPRLQPAIGEVAAKLDADTTITAVCYNYSTRDMKERTLTMSSLLLILQEKEHFSAKHLWLENRATQASDQNVPSHQWNIGAAHVLRHHVLVSPDLMGFGASVEEPVCYCVGELAARNTVDAIIAAQKLLMEHYQLIDTPLPVLNSGHSQGGFDALAVHRYMETQATQEEKKWLPLAGTWCADGPYAPDVVTEVCSQWEKYLYGAYMVMNIMSHLNYHPECFEDGLTAEDFLTEEGEALGIVDLINAKKTGNKELVKVVIGALGLRPAKLFKEEVYQAGGRLYEMIMDCSRKERQIDGWTPSLPIHFYHVHADECVPVEAMKEVERAWGHLPNVTFEDDMTPLTDIPNGMAHAYSGGVFHRRLLEQEIWE